MINMAMDENLSLYGNCGIYDSAANAIYIGESFNKYHSSLYGYDLKTNPLLEIRKENMFIMRVLVE